jgi:hypothetical protein
LIHTEINMYRHNLVCQLSLVTYPFVR